MKATKKLLAFLLAATMLLALLPSAFATATSYTLTLTGTKVGHTYAVYQIFKGTLSDDGTKLSDVKYGSSWDNTVKLGDPVPEEVLASWEKNSGAQNIEEFAKHKQATYKTVQSCDGKTLIDLLEPGYYAVFEVTENVSGHDSYSRSIIYVLGNAEAAIKSSVPISEKKVRDINDSIGTPTGWQDSADYDIGDEIDFKLTATLADDVNAYVGPYKVIFHDKQSAGLTFKKISSVNVGGKVLNNTQYTLDQTPSDGCSFHITIADVKADGIKAADSAVVTVEYVAELNENAVIGSTGNPNEMYLEFSNNPNVEGGSTGTTPKDTVIVFTYKINIDKINQEKKPLGNAGFTLYKIVNNVEVLVKEIKATKDGTKFEFKGLDDGDYVLRETETPDGYNTIEDIKFTITASHDEEADAPKLISLDFGHLGTGDITTGGLTTNFQVENRAGNTLPSTGGMGTTIFYVLGSILAIGAAILLISKKRMNGVQ